MFVPRMDRPIEDITNPQLEPFLRDLQGNILKSHGRDHAALLVLSFGPSTTPGGQPMAARAWLRSLANSAAPRITSAFQQEQQTAARKAGVTDGSETFQTLALSSRGYEFLSIRRPEGAFRDGMQSRGPMLNDPPVSAWEPSYQQNPRDIHALLQIANKDVAPIDAEIARVRAEVAAFGGSVLIEERGLQQRTNNEPVEHFGYRDGVSQPVFIRDTTAPQHLKYDQHAALKLVLVADPSGPERFGSFLVYRKLEQDVRGFEAAIASVVATPGVEIDEVLAGAMTIGRFKDGTPVVLSGTPLGDNGDMMDFDYGEDEDGQKCPFAGHVRKVNPRRELPFLVNILAQEQRRRIARRGITYGERPDRTGAGPIPNSGIGLLFMCYQNDIADQFEFIQRRWANSKDFRKDKVGLDPIIGQSANAVRTTEEFPRWPVKRDSGTKKNIENGGHVRLVGGEYFFTPSMATLRTI